MTPSFIYKPPHAKLQFSHPLALSLKQAYLFNEIGGTTLRDGSTNTEYNTITINSASFANGPFGSALSFNGTSDYGIMLDNITNGWSGDKGTTVVVFTPSIINSTVRDIIRKGSSSGAGATLEYLSRITTTNKFAGGFVNSSGTLTFPTGATTLVVGVTYVGVCVYNGIDVRIYLDGILDAAPGALTGNINHNSGTLGLGASMGPPTQFFGGLISAFYVYDRALSADEAAWISQDPFAMFRHRRILKASAAPSQIFGYTNSPMGSIRRVPNIIGY